MAAKPKPKSIKSKIVPWASLAREMVKIGKEEDDADQTAWAMWFELGCPKTYALVNADPDAMVELYEQLSGRGVKDEDEEEEEPKGG